MAAMKTGSFPRETSKRAGRESSLLEGAQTRGKAAERKTVWCWQRKGQMEGDAAENRKSPSPCRKLTDNHVFCTRSPGSARA